MRLLLDACLSPRLVPRIADLFDDVVHVFDCGGIASDDTCIWDFAKDGRYTIVTKDSDFFYRSELAGFPPKVVWLRVGNAGTSTVAQLVRARAPALKSFDRDPNAAILVVDLQLVDHVGVLGHGFSASTKIAPNWNNEWKTVTSRWPSGVKEGAEFSIPVMK